MPGRIVKKAIVVGIDQYRDHPTLRAPDRDAVVVAELLRTHHDGSPNWQVDLWCESERGMMKPADLADAVRSLFLTDVEGDDELHVLLYFSGHAVSVRNRMVELQTYEGYFTDFASIVSKAAGSGAATKTVILDCCLSGAIGNNPDPFYADLATLPADLTILTASSPDSVAKEDDEHGHFTRHLIGGLQGAAGDLLGDVTALSLFSHVGRALAAVDQHPQFKSHSTRPVVLRRAAPHVPVSRLVPIRDYFGDGDHAALTYFHEGVPEGHPLADDDENEGATPRGSKGRPAFSGSLRQIELDHYKMYRDAHLLRTCDGRDFYFVCTEPVGEDESNRVELTPLGRYYRDLAAAGALDERLAQEPADPAPGG